KALRDVFDFTPRGIIRALGLQNPIYRRTAAYGHFGREPMTSRVNGREVTLFPWERTDRIDDLRTAVGGRAPGRRQYGRSKGAEPRARPDVQHARRHPAGGGWCARAADLDRTRRGERDRDGAGGDEVCQAAHARSVRVHGARDGWRAASRDDHE